MGWLRHRLALAEGELLPWAAVLMAAGAALWLNWPGPTRGVSLAALGLLAVLPVLRWRSESVLWRAAAGAGIALLCGFVLVEIRSARVAAPVLGFRYYGPIEGRVVDIDRSASDRMRLTLDQVALQKVPPHRLPERIRVSLQQEGAGSGLSPGMRLRVTGHLSPPEGPTEPGGFDFQRHAWFKRIGAIGYSRKAVEVLAEPLWHETLVTRLRLHLSGAMQAALPGEAGAFAAAMMTGDRSGMGARAVQDLRDSNLYHLVSISGVHMSLLTGFVFLGLRSGLALVPWVALRLPVHKLAAVVALAVAAFYLMLAGGDVATTRAFVMVAVMLGAVLCDRRAISLRSVALAAIVLMIWQPEAVADPGFQMSFAATAALVSGYGALAPWLSSTKMRVWARVPLSLLAASALAGFASAPFAALHFNRYSEYGLVANLLASPLMGMIVMPAGALSALLAPLGLAGPALWLLDWGCHLILLIAQEVAGWTGAVRLVSAPGPLAAPLLALGFAGAVLWRGWMKVIGASLLLLTAAVWSGSERPELLIASDGNLVGLSGEAGRALSRPRGAGFTARNWLENDGDATTQERAAARPGFNLGPREAGFLFAGVPGLHLLGKASGERVGEGCRRARIVILAERAPLYPRGCLVLDATALRALGAVALRARADGGLDLQWSNASGRPWAAHRPKAIARARALAAGIGASGQPRNAAPVMRAGP